MAEATPGTSSASPAVNDSLLDRVQFTVDGTIVNARAPPAGTRITSEDLLLRFSQQADILKHANFIFLGGEDYVKEYVKQSSEQQELLQQQVAEVTAQRDAAAAASAPAG